MVCDCHNARAAPRFSSSAAVHSAAARASSLSLTTGASFGFSTDGVRTNGCDGPSGVATDGEDEDNDDKDDD